MFRLMVMNGLLICLMLIWTSTASVPPKELGLKSQAEAPTQPKEDPRISTENSKDYVFVPDISSAKDVKAIANFRIIEPHPGNYHDIARSGNHTYSQARDADQKGSVSNPQYRVLKSGNQLLLFSEEKLSWVNAQKECKAKDGALAILGDEPEDVFAYISEHYDRKSFWLGGSDIKEEGNWLWLNGNPIDRTKNWRSREPNSWGNEDCLWVYRGSYYDKSCAREYQYICDLKSEANIPFHVRTQHLSFSDERLYWEDAKEDCEAKQGTLAILEDEPEDVVAHIASHYAGIAFWLGGSDIAKEGNWSWLNGNAIDRTKIWRRGEPNSWGTEDCLEYYYGYNDRTCRKRNRYICDLGEVCKLGSIKSENYTLSRKTRTIGIHDCDMTWDYSWGENPPIFIDQNDGRILNKRANEETSLLLVCSGPNNHINNAFFQNKKGILLQCKDRRLHYDCQSHSLQKFPCASEVLSSTIISTPPQTCGKQIGGIAIGTLYHIGFDNGLQYGFHKLIDVCFNVNEETTLWTQHTLKGKSIRWPASSNTKKTWKLGVPTLWSFAVTLLGNILSSSEDQTSFFTTNFGRTNIIKKEESLYLARGHMTPNGDFSSKAEREATFNYMNALPQWQVINNAATGGNWGGSRSIPCVEPR